MLSKGNRAARKLKRAQIGEPLLQVRPTMILVQHAEWEQSRDQAVSDEEIDLNAGDDPDEWSVYLTSIPQTK
jgi:aromatic ring-opening dioxygenase catalytic subunit (LigB family)